MAVVGVVMIGAWCAMPFLCAAELRRKAEFGEGDDDDD
jgi:hypothetical protein